MYVLQLHLDGKYKHYVNLFYFQILCCNKTKMAKYVMAFALMQGKQLIQLKPHCVSKKPKV